MPDQPTQAPRAARLEAILRAALDPVQLDVEDESANHAGHSGAREGGQTHYKVRVVSEHFTGIARIARTRMVNNLLAGEFNSGLHALSMILRSPGEV